VTSPAETELQSEREKRIKVTESEKEKDKRRRRYCRQEYYGVYTLKAHYIYLKIFRFL
jgi:hypothetical protein